MRAASSSSCRRRASGGTRAARDSGARAGVLRAARFGIGGHSTSDARGGATQPLLAAASRELLHGVTFFVTPREDAMSSPGSPSLFSPVPDAQVAAGLAAPRAHGARRSAAAWIDLAVVAALSASGLLCPQGAAVFYRSLLLGFAGIAGSVIAGAWAVTLFA